MKKFIITFVFLSALILVVEHLYLFAAKSTEEVNESIQADDLDLDSAKNIEIEVKSKPIIDNNTMIANATESENVVTIENDRPKRPLFNSNHCDLPDDVLDYIYQVGEIENNISYTLLIAMAMVESTCNADAKSHTNDSGLFQINKHTVPFLAELAEIENVNKYDPYHSADMAVAYLVYLRDKYSSENIPEEDLFFYMVMGYHYGETKLPKYIKKHGLKSKYVDKILDAKMILEQDVIIE